MLLDILVLIAGLVVLILGANWLVSSASGLARRFGIPPLVVGLTVVAFGTSLPELVVNITAALSGAGDLSFGNIIGSNISNIGFIIGASALLFPLAVRSSTIKKEMPLMVLAGLVLLALIIDAGVGFLSRNDGYVLLLLFMVFLYYLANTLKEGDKSVSNEFAKEYKDKKRPLWLLSGLAAIGILATVIGGRLTVESAINIASSLGVSDALIGLTIIAIGTSLPELATSVVAAWRKHPDIAVGNIVGSNIFNLLLILGISTAITPIPINHSWIFDVAAMLCFSAILWLFTATHKRTIIRIEGFILLVLYIGYMAFVTLRG